MAIEERVAAIEAVASSARPWLTARVTDDQLLADIADGYDVCVMGADKWHQLHDVDFYGGSTASRDDALARLPQLAVAPREGIALPDDPDVVVLDVAPTHHGVSSTGARQGRDEWRATP